MPKQATPDLTLPLARPIALTGGPDSHLVTLMDAAILIRDLEPFRQARPVWDRAAEMILLARPASAPTFRKQRASSWWRWNTRIGGTAADAAGCGMMK